MARRRTDEYGNYHHHQSSSAQDSPASSSLSYEEFSVVRRRHQQTPFNELFRIVYDDTSSSTSGGDEYADDRYDAARGPPCLRDLAADLTPAQRIAASAGIYEDLTDADVSRLADLRLTPDQVRHQHTLLSGIELLALEHGASSALPAKNGALVPLPPPPQDAVESVRARAAARGIPLDRETVPYEVLDSLCDALCEHPPSEQADLFVHLLTYESQLVLTERPARTERRSALRAFEDATRGLRSSVQTLARWRAEDFEPWGGRRVVEREHEALARSGAPGEPLPDTLPAILRALYPNGALVLDIYRVDDNFYAFCFFAQRPLTDLYTYLGCFYTQSEQAHFHNMTSAAVATDRRQ